MLDFALLLPNLFIQPVMKASFFATKFSATLLLAVALLAGGCDSDSDDTVGEADVSADDIEVVSITPGVEDGAVYFNIVVENESDVAIDVIEVNFRLLSGDTVVASASAINTDALQPGQQGSARADFFDTESLDAFACYEYDVEIVVAGPPGALDQESYPGTCGG